MSGPGTAVIVTGDKEVDAAMRRLEPAMQKKALRSGTRKGTKIVEADARARVPELTGELEQSMKTRAAKRRRNSIGHEVNVGADVSGGDVPFYSLFIEFGTKGRRHESGKFAGQILPDPFLRPALHENRQKVKAEVVKEIKAWLRKRSLI